MKEREDFGLLGRDDFDEGEEELSMSGFGVMDKLVNSMFNSLMKNLDKQFKNQFRELADSENTEVRTFPNGVRIKISGPFDASGAKRNLRPRPVKVERRQIDEGQLKRMSSLPRAIAKASVKRF